MRRGGPNHPKVALLAADLHLPVYAAIGLLEALWHWTDYYAPRGDIGRYTDAVIATGVGWDGEAAMLVESLVRCRWVDADEVHRLVVHDWHHHADQYTRRRLATHGDWFVRERKQVGKTAITDGRRRRASRVSTRSVRALVAEHCVKTEEGASPSTPLSAQSGTESKPEAKLIDEINRVSGRAFKPVEANLKFARARLADYPLDELVRMLRWRWKTWDEGMRAQWYRPETLLNATKCESYMGSMPAAERAGIRPAKAVNPELERIAARERELGMRS